MGEGPLGLAGRSGYDLVRIYAGSRVVVNTQLLWIE